MTNEEIKELLEANFKAMRARIDANASITDLLYKSIEKQNGRIRCLEKETSFFRLVHRNPGRTTLVVIAVVLGIIFAYIKNIWIF